MSKQEFLRQWLCENGYRFIGERLVWDKDVLYPIFLIKAGECPPLSLGQIYGGVLLQDDPLWGDYLSAQIVRLERAYAGLRQSKDAAAAEKAGSIHAILSELKAIKEVR